MRAIEHFIDFYRRHAAMIDRAITEHAWGTLRRMSQDLCIWRERTSRQRISRTKNHDRGASECRADVRGSGVVSHDQIRAVEHRYDLIETRLARQHNGRVLHAPHNVFSNIKLVFRANQ